MRTESRLGRVTTFDSARGLGTLGPVDPPGAAGEDYPFHCTAITDGSRQVEVGTLVAFVLSAGLGGQVEARSVRPLRDRA